MTTPDLGGSVICLETEMEKDYSQFLTALIEEAKESADSASIELLRSFWGNTVSWEEIQERAAVEGCTWYVWWMDGVRAYIRYEIATEVTG